MQILRTISWQDGKVILDSTPAEIREIAQDQQTLIWVDISGEAAPYADMLSETFGLSKLILETIDEASERAKFVERTSYCYMVVHALQYDAQADEACTPDIDIVFGQHFIITIHREAFAWLDDLRQEVGSAEQDEYQRNRRMGYLLYQILDHLVDSYFPVLDTIDGIIDDLEDITISDTSNEVQVRLFRIKRSLAHMRRVISPQVEVANSLRGRADHFIPDDLMPYLSDVYDHLIRAFEILDSYRDLMSGLLDVYLTTVSNRLNVIMKQLAIVATVFLPITFITGVFGMNFGHSPQVDFDNGYNFWIVLGIMILVTLGQIWFFKKRKWL